jgi:hypothetical protein
MLHTYPINEIMHARLYDLELMLRTVMERERKTGQQTSIMYIMDLNGLSYDSRLLTLLTGALSGISAFMAEHYVELIHTFVLVNAPSFISAIWYKKACFTERFRKHSLVDSITDLEFEDPDSIPSRSQIFLHRPKLMKIFFA